MDKLPVSSTTLTPLPNVLSKGLVPVAFFGMLSFFCTTALFGFLTFRLVKWKLFHQQKTESTNQFIILIYNLLLADIQQSIAFLLNANTLRRDGIFVGNSMCWAQGWFISTGDLANSLFIMAIAVHTFLSVVKDYRMPTWAFYLWITSLWAFNYILGMIGPLAYGEDFFTRAAAWVSGYSLHEQ